MTAEACRQRRCSGWTGSGGSRLPGWSALCLLSGGQQVPVLRVMADRLLLNVLERCKLPECSCQKGGRACVCVRQQGPLLSAYLPQRCARCVLTFLCRNLLLCNCAARPAHFSLCLPLLLILSTPRVCWRSPRF